MITMRRLTVLLFGLLFVALKLTDKIAWSWWVVLAPLWVGHAIVAFAACVQVILWLMMTPQERALLRLKTVAEELARRSR